MAPVSSVAEVRAVSDALLGIAKIRSATHNILGGLQCMQDFVMVVFITYLTAWRREPRCVGALQKASRLTHSLYRAMASCYKGPIAVALVWRPQLTASPRRVAASSR